MTKTIRAADPAHVEKIDFFYGLRLPTLRFEHVNAPAKRIALKLMAPAVRALAKLFPKQGNQFGFAITKTGRLRDWLEVKDGKVRLSPEKAGQRGQRYVKVFETIYSERTDLYFWAPDGDLPFSPGWPHATGN